MTRSAALLDVNVLMALAWPNHEGHFAARAWFDHESEHGWATTPMTECGFVRVSSNRRALPTSTSPSIAIDMLRRLQDLPGHEFWPDTVSLVHGVVEAPLPITGHQQVTDAHLVALASQRGGRLVTFDHAIATLAPTVDVELLQF